MKALDIHIKPPFLAFGKASAVVVFEDLVNSIEEEE
jgi:hypothetical protein